MEAKRRVAARFHVSLELFRWRSVLCQRLLLAKILEVVWLAAGDIVLQFRRRERVIAVEQHRKVDLRGFEQLCHLSSGLKPTGCERSAGRQ